MPVLSLWPMVKNTSLDQSNQSLLAILVRLVNLVMDTVRETVNLLDEGARSRV